ncbi:hypothetical protein OPKNFCMD_3254 [Methylobacterium crusticola]|uniref:Transposase n=1 Tax=Methylobacterium crusticola TaxID=1697972 RepID=A0ABQ4R0Y1_9HYPH|nr:hypothetical protein OPKNFCMD_3254 [Methylobacterium crusticola]
MPRNASRTNKFSLLYGRWRPVRRCTKFFHAGVSEPIFYRWKKELIGRGKLEIWRL